MSITVKTWTGAESERFTHDDMNRICSNANTVATAILWDTVTYPTASRSTQLDISAMQALEKHIAEMSGFLGISDGVPYTWAPGMTISYVDLNRWEQSLKAIEDASATGFTLKVLVPGPGVPAGEGTWKLSDSDGTVVHEGNGLNPVTRMRIASAGTYTLRLDLYGFGAGISLTLGRNYTLDMTSRICVLNVTSNKPFTTLEYNGCNVTGISGTTAVLSVWRSEYSFSLSMVADTGDSPIYDGIATGLLWSWKAETEVVPNTASKSVTLTAERKGNPLYVTGNGDLIIPVLATYDVWVIGPGHNGSYSGGGSGGCPEFKSASFGPGSAEVRITGWDYYSTFDIGAVHIAAYPSGTFNGATGGGYITNNGVYDVYNDASDSNGKYTGGGGAPKGISTGGGGGSLAGGGGGTNSPGENGTPVDGWTAKGGASPYAGLAGYGNVGGGGGGGYGADGGDGGPYDGGGGGGVLGGRGGDAGNRVSGDAHCFGTGGLGYGAGGGGFSGGGGGLGPFKLAGDGPIGKGAPGAARITWVSDA